jgi:FKBP-type peptidyl-prolyl cis-trans isomerase FkpA
MVMIIRVLVFSFLLSLCSCEEEQPKLAVPPGQLKEYLIEQNLKTKEAEKERIESYIKKHQLNMQETATGLRYMMQEEGEGELAKFGQVAEVKFKVYLFSGTVCYESEEDETMKFLIGEDHVETGLHEAVLLMKEGDKMKVILPSYLAHGIVGDQDCIPMMASVVYDIELVKLHSK